MTQVVIATFYKFVQLADYRLIQPELLAFCKELELKGTILLAEEGINATVAGSREAIELLLADLRSDGRFTDMTHKESYADFMPFERMKVRLKREIVNLGQPGISPLNQVGTYVPADAWNDLISDPDVVLVDTRNHFEYQVGTFKGAINPETDAFNQFPKFVEENLNPTEHKKVAMFCTGGIRCEKATSLLLDLGFEEVYHLKDGILKYLEEVPAEESLWQGQCFVFDDRVAVGHGLAVAECELCPACATAVDDPMRQSPQYKQGVYCPNCFETLEAERVARLDEKMRQKHLAAQRKAQVNTVS